MKTFSNFCFLIIFLLLCSTNIFSQPTNLGWPYVRIGFTEHCMNAMYHPTSPHRAYVRFDMNFVHRRDAVGEDWKLLNEGFPSNTDLFAQVRQCVGMAIDPNNTNVLYVAGGSGTSSGAGLYKSTNSGGTFTRIFPTTPGTIYVKGNVVADRWEGEPIAVDPYNSNVIYFGTQKDGLYRTTDGGTSWTKVANDPATSTWGFKAVRIAKKAVTTGTPVRAKYIYAYAEANGVFESRDGGTTFTKITGFPNTVSDIEISGENYLYASGNDCDGIYRYNINTLTFNGKRSSTKGNIASMTENNTGKIIMTGNLEDKVGYIYRSTNRGDTWETLTTANGRVILDDASKTLNKPDSWNLNGGALHPDGKRFLVGGVYNLYETTDIFASTIVFKLVPHGAEKEVCSHMTCPPASPSGKTAELYTGVSDASFYWIDDPQNITSANSQNVLRGYDSDYCESNPEIIWITSRGGQSGSKTVVLKSLNGKDVKWDVGNLYPFGALTNISSSAIASRSTHGNHALVAAYTTNSGTLRYTKDSGVTWYSPIQTINDVSCSDNGIDMWKTRRPICADRVNGNYYAYSSISGKFYRSTDGGTNFTTVNTAMPTGSGYGFYFNLQSVPGKANHLLLSFAKGPNKAIYSTDGGTTWGEFSEFEATRVATAGPGINQGDGTAYYVWGKMPGNYWGVYVCTNFVTTGRVWQRVTQSRNVFILPQKMVASRQVPGRVFIHANKWHYIQYQGSSQNAPSNFPDKSTPDIVISPNPNDGSSMNIDLSGLPTEKETANVAIYSLSGKKVYQNEFARNNHINLTPNLDKGVYLLVIDNVWKKIVVR